MTAALVPLKKGLAPAEVWSPFMETDPPVLPGEMVKASDRGLICNLCGCYGCPYEPMYRNGGAGIGDGGPPTSGEYMGISRIRFDIPSWPYTMGLRYTLSSSMDVDPMSCTHRAQRYTPELGWRCRDCGKKA